MPSNDEIKKRAAELEKRLKQKRASTQNTSAAAGVDEDWLAKASRESNEALAKQAAKKQPPAGKSGKRVDDAIARGADDAEIKRLAALSPMEYDRERKDAAKKLRVRASTLHHLVDVERKQQRRKTPLPAKPLDAITAEKNAGNLVGCANILDRFATVITNAGLIGETNNAKILYLALTSRLFDHEVSRPVSVAVKGVSAGGKSFTVESVLKFFPVSAHLVRSAYSDKALYFSDENFEHRVLVLLEAIGMGPDRGQGGEVNHFAYAIRTLLSENRLNYELTVKTDAGLKSQVIDKKGPTGLITTTTATKLHPEIETRLLSLSVIDTPEQTKAIMRALAAGKVDDTDYTPWHAFQEWLATGERRVVIPFGDNLANSIPPMAVRLRRDFGALRSLIMAHTLLHRETRKRDSQGRFIATIMDDYAAIYHLVGKLLGEGVGATVSTTIRDTVEAVEKCLNTAGNNSIGRDGVPTAAILPVAKMLGLHKTVVSRRVRAAITAGYLVNQEDRNGKPARLRLGDPLPSDESEILPSPTVLLGTSFPGFPLHRCIGCQKNPSETMGLTLFWRLHRYPPPMQCLKLI